MTREEVLALDKMRKSYLQVFNTDTGRVVLEDLKKKCFVYDTTYTGDASTSLVNEGMRRVLLHVENIMTLDLDKELAKLEEINDVG